MNYFVVLSLVLLATSFTPGISHAQIFVEGDSVATDEASATFSAILKEEEEKKKGDVTKPEVGKEKEEVLKLFEKRNAEEPTFTNLTAYAVQSSVRTGVPANTIVLILLLPVLATLIVFFRYVVGLPGIGLLVPIAFSITLLATGITAGILLLFTIFSATTLSRLLLKKVRIMQLPKIALSIFVVAVLISAMLTMSAFQSLFDVSQLSIFPVLLLILLSEQIVSLQLERTVRETVKITAVTLAFGVIGYFLLAFDYLRDFVLLYPEVILLLVPINLLIGRYFGLRLNEYFRFAPIRDGIK